MGVTAKHLKSGFKTLLYYGVDSLAYRLHALMPVYEHRALFVEMTEPGVTHDFARVMDCLQRAGFLCAFVSLQKGRVSGMRYVANCMRVSWTAARSRLVIVRDACMPVGCLPLRDETKVVQLWHGCGAFKKFGMSTNNKTFGISDDEAKRFPHYGNVSLVTVSSPEVVWAYEEAMGLEEQPGIVQPLGVSRTDAFFDEAQLTLWRDEAKRMIPQSEGKKILLYAPTFRGQVTEPTAPDFLKMEKLCEQLGEDWVLLIKHHPFVCQRPSIPATCRDFAYDVTESLSIEAAMVAADVCITDYSSLVFEWSLLNKPIAFFAPDKDDYDDGRGFYYDYSEFVPGPIFQNTDELAKWIARADELYDFDALLRFKDRFMSSCDGHATERIVSAMLV